MISGDNGVGDDVVVGWLMKRSDWLKQWRRRYAVLNGPKLLVHDALGR